MRTAIVAIYVLAWNGFVIGGCAYLVGWRGWSPWWFLLAVLIGAKSSRVSEAGAMPDCKTSSPRLGKSRAK